jgi:WD40 repeat protein
MSSNFHLVSVGKNVLIHNENDEDSLISFNHHKANINCMELNLYGTVIATGSDDSSINFSGIKDQKVLLSLQEGKQSSSVTSLKFSSDCKRIVSGKFNIFPNS